MTAPADDDDGRRHVPAAKVFVMGVGVAGLQAIATARRLGAW
jgi:NAD/NADP transhydrogenase alpha subunit